jgi:ribonuclease III family protein
MFFIDALATPQTEASHAFHPRALAHLGDAVYELAVRELALLRFPLASSKQLHHFSTARAKASFQAALLTQLEPHLTEAEQATVKQARNLPVPASRKAEQGVYRQATALEALVGYWALFHPERLHDCFKPVFQLASQTLDEGSKADA